MAGLRDLTIPGGRTLPASLLSPRYSRSGGPGGQNVNKVATKVDVRLDLEGSVEFLGEWAVGRIREKLSNRLDSDGCLQVTGSEHRDQARNLEAVLARMENLIGSALERKKPRRPTKPSRGSKERRLAEKKRRGELKKLRSKPID